MARILMPVNLYMKFFDKNNGWGSTMKESKRVIKNIIEFVIFIGIIALIFSKVTWIFRSNNRENRENILGFKNQGNVDVVVYGNSSILRGYQPLEAYNSKGFTSYNYATTNETANLLTFFIRESRTSNEASLYVVDIRAFVSVHDVIYEPSIRNWSDTVAVFSPIRIMGITSYLFSKNWEEYDVVPFYFDIAEYHSVYDALADPYQWSYINTNNIYNVDKSFNAVVENIPFTRPEISDERGELTKTQLYRLNELLDYCDKEELPVLFIVSPCVITMSDWKSLNTCGDIIQERGYDFINVNNCYDEIGFDFETDFYDMVHLNYLGSEKFTKYLMNYISDNYSLPDHRGDENYLNWDNDYNTFALLQESWREDNVSLVEQHLKIKELGESFHHIDDFSTWFESVQDENFTIVIVKNQCETYDTDDLAFNTMLLRWGIDTAQPNYIGIWQGERNLFSTNDDSYEGEVGLIKRGYTIPCMVNTGENPQISVDDIDYFNNLPGIQILVIDNNYRRVVDNVNVYVDESGVHFTR